MIGDQWRLRSDNGCDGKSRLFCAVRQAPSLDAVLLQLAALLGRAPPLLATAAAAGRRCRRRIARPLGPVQRFRALVEARFRQQPSPVTLANSLGITPTPLNRVCPHVLGHSALGGLPGRRVLEAPRDGAYSRLAVI